MAQIFDIKKFAVHDGDGIRTTVFFKGCPLQCIWCHNPEGIFAKPQISLAREKCMLCEKCASLCPQSVHRIINGKHEMQHWKCIACGSCEQNCLYDALKLYGRDETVENLLPVLLEDRDFYEASNGGVTLSGGECLLQADFCAQLLKRLKEHQIHTAVDTCGFVSVKAFDSVIPYTDVFLYDIKAIDEAVHIKCTGHSNRLILDNLMYLNEQGCKVEIRIPYVPGYNSDQIPQIAAFLQKLSCITKVRVLAYHNYAGSKYESLGLKNTLPPDLPEQSEMEQARTVLCAHGLPVAT